MVTPPVGTAGEDGIASAVWHLLGVLAGGGRTAGRIVPAAVRGSRARVMAPSLPLRRMIA